MKITKNTTIVQKIYMIWKEMWSYALQKRSIPVAELVGGGNFYYSSSSSFRNCASPDTVSGGIGSVSQLYVVL